MSPFIKLPNGVIFNASKVVVIARQDINDYIMVLEGCPVNPKMDLAAVEMVEKLLDVTVLQEPPKVVSA